MSRSQLYRMIASEEMMAYKLRGPTLIRHDELTRMLEGASIIDVTKRPQAAMK